MRPALRCVSRTPARGPLPHHADGVRPPTCRPLPTPLFPSSSRSRRIRNASVPAEGRDLGGSTSPSPWRGVRRRAAAPFPASRFLESRAEITPSPLGADLGTWAGPRPPPHSTEAFQNLVPQTKFSDPNAERGADAGDSTCPLLAWGGRGDSQVSTRSLPSETSPPLVRWLSVKRPPLIVVPHPAGPLGVISSRVADFPPRTLECCHPAAGLGASQLSSSGDPDTRCATGPSFPGAVPRVLSFLVPRNQGPWSRPGRPKEVSWGCGGKDSDPPT